MDPFCRLPWFILQAILSNLGDLHSLHQLHNASPAIAAFLHDNNDLFVGIVDAIIRHPDRERGLLPHVQHAVRQLVLIWNLASESEPLNADESSAEALHQSYTDVVSNLRYLRKDWEPSPTEVAMSKSTPSSTLCQLLALMARLRNIAHACFHSMIARCLTVRMEHLPPKTRYLAAQEVVDRSRRPQGIPYAPRDIGPITWFEEQRLIYCLLCVVLFFELRKTHMKPLVVTIDRRAVQIMLDDMGEFWKTILHNDDKGEVEQILTLLEWLDEQAGGREKLYTWLLSGSIPDKLSHCCDHYTSMTYEQWEKAELDMYQANYKNGNSRGMQCMRTCRIHRVSPLRCVKYSVFRPYGLIFWDCIRLDALGFPAKNRLCPMWFAWSCVLSEEDWGELVRLQLMNPRGNEFGPNEYDHLLGY